MSTVVDRAYLEINGIIIVCNSLDEDIDPETKPVEAMTRDNRILGWAQGNPKFKFTAEVAMEADLEDQIDFEDMALTREQFSAGIEYEGSRSKTYVDCVIMKVALKSRTGQHTTYSLDIGARDLVKN